MTKNTTSMNNNCISSRTEYALVFDAHNSNPNGDPDNGNSPRYDEQTGLAYVTNQCWKAKTRKYLSEVLGVNLLMCPEQHVSLEAKIAEAAGDLISKGSKKGMSQGDIQKALDAIKDKYYDVRAFGGVMTGGLNKGIKGAVQVQDAESVNQVEIADITLTRGCVSRENEDESKDRTMGRKSVLRYCAFIVKITVNPYFAEKSHFSQEDLAKLEDCLRHMLSIDQSACRCLTFRKLVKFTHKDKLGNASSADTLDAVKLVSKVETPRDFSDFDLVIPSKIPNVDIKVMDEFDR